jgi:hypothetical protein
MNPINNLDQVIKHLSGFFPQVSMHIKNAIEAYKYSLQGLSYNQTTILDVILVANYINSVHFDDMVRYMLNGDKPMERRFIVEKEVKRLIRMNDDNNKKINTILNDPNYQDRLFFVFNKKQRV